MAELTEEEEVLAWDNAPEWMKRMVLGGSRHEIGTLQGQVDASRGLGNRFDSQDYLDITTALSSYKTSGENKVNALRRVMDRSGTFSMGTGGLSGASIKTIMDLQGKDILSKIVEMQSNAGLTGEREHRDWYTTMQLDPYYYEDARKAFISAEKGGDRAAAHDESMDAKTTAREQAAVDSLMPDAVSETTNINGLKKWLIDEKIPQKYWAGAYEKYENIATSKRAVADQLMQVEGHEQTTDAYKRDKNIAGQKKFAEETMRGAGEEVANLVRGGMSLDDAIVKVNSKYSDIPYFTASGLETQAEALVGSRTERAGIRTSTQKLMQRQLEGLGFPKFVPTVKVLEDGTKDITPPDLKVVKQSQKDITLLFIEHMADQATKNPISLEVTRDLREAQAWQHLLDLKNTTENPITQEDIAALRVDVKKLEESGNVGENDDEVMARIMKFALLYGIPFNMALYIQDPQAYAGYMGALMSNR